MRLRFIHSLALASLALAVACDSPSGEERPTAEELRASVLKGDAQADSAGSRLADTLVVRVTDDRGRPVSDLTVGWTVLTQGGGEPFLATVQTDADGRARNFWNLGTRAGAHEMEVRAILDGVPVVLDTIRATARPGAAVSAAVSGDTVRGIARLQTTRVLLSGTDRHGNAIAAGDVAAAWASSAPGVATVGADGTVTAAAPGRTTVTATGSGWALRVHVTVNGTAQTVRSVPFALFNIHGGGSRILGAGASVAVRQNGAWTTEPGLETARSMDAVRVLPSGEGWALGVDASGRALWRSPMPGAWSKVALPLNASPSLLASAVGNMFVANATGSLFRRDGDAWTPLGTAPEGPFRQILSLSAASGNEVYAAGLTQTTFGDGAGRPYLARWEGGTWSSVAIPAAVVRTNNTVVRHVAAPTDGGPVYAVVWAAGATNTFTLLRVTGGVASVVALPPSMGSVRIDGLAVGPGGGPVLAGGSWVAYQVNGAWREHLLTDNWVVLGTPFVDGAGTVYVPVTRSVNGQQESAVIELETF